LGAGYGCEYLEKKVVVAAAVAVVRASAGGSTHVLDVGSDLWRGRARVRVAARLSITFNAPPSVGDLI